MVMTKTDDILLKDFFNENKQDIADGGFTRRVMHNLPDSGNRITRILTLICLVISTVLFVIYDGFHAIIGIMREVFVSVIQNGIAIFDLKTFLMAGAVLACWGLSKIYRMN